MNPLRAPENGEVVKLGPPASGEVIMTVDPRAAGTTFAAGTQTLRPGAEMPVHKHLDRETVLFVYKGQGRVTLNERVINVVPGAMLHVPRGAWYGVRNTGTGAFQIAWVSAPPGLEAFFRDLSRLGDLPSAQALQELAQRHRIEFRQAADAPVPAGRRRPARAPSASALPATLSSAPVEPSAATSAAPAAPSAPRGPRHRRHRRGGGRQPSGWRHSLAPRSGLASLAALAGKDSPGSVAGRRSTPPSSAPAATAPRSSRPGTGRQPSARHHRSRRVKEVYMNGQWVRVEGDGPAISSDFKRPGRRNPKRGGDEDSPGVPLSVLL